MPNSSILPLAEIVTAFTGVVTMVIAVIGSVVLWRTTIPIMRETHAQTGELVKSTAKLVIHTNSLTDKLMEKTDLAARAEGVKEGIAQQLSTATESPAVVMAKEAAEAAALIIKDAAEQAARVLATAVAVASSERSKS